MISVGQLKVLQAIIYEGMRIYPPVPAGLQRSAPKGGAVVAGHFVPEGVSDENDMTPLINMVPSWTPSLTAMFPQ